MSDLNCCAFTGRLTADAEVKLIGAKQTPCCEFTIANNTGFGQYAKTSYFSVQLWGQSGTNLQQYLKKGQPVAISGSLEQNNWVDQNGQKHSVFRLSARDVTLLNARQKADTSSDIPTDYTGAVF